MAGLSAAWRLDKRGFRDFALLEMLKQPGGNARSGENEISAYPLGGALRADSEPEIAAGSRTVRRAGPAAATEVWEERHFAFRRRSGCSCTGAGRRIEPESASTARDRSSSGSSTIACASSRKPSSSRFPSIWAQSLRRARCRAVDSLGSRKWVRFAVSALVSGLRLPGRLRGASAACRPGPGFITSLPARTRRRGRSPGRKATAGSPGGWPGNSPLYPRGCNGPQHHPRGRKAPGVRLRHPILCDQVIFAAPTFLASYLMDGLPRVPITYSPWVTANLTLDRLPVERGFQSLGTTSSTSRTRSAMWMRPTSR